MRIIPGWNRKFCDRGECEMALESGETPQIRHYFNNVFYVTSRAVRERHFRQKRQCVKFNTIGKINKIILDSPL